MCQESLNPPASDDGLRFAVSFGGEQVAQLIFDVVVYALLGLGQISPRAYRYGIRSFVFWSERQSY
jgi:hypothetical protein